MANEALPTSMWAWRKHRSNPGPVFEEVPVPLTPSQGYLVRVLAAGVCHSDYNLLNNPDQPPHFNESYTLGHECCGVIVSIGDKVSKESLKLGDRVVVYPVPGCGSESCDECSRDLSQLCVTGDHYGIGQDGSFTDYVAVNARAVVPLPDNIPPSVASVATDAVLTAYHATFRRGNVKKGDLVYQFGLGGLGFNALQMMLAFGIRVIVSDPKEEVLKHAENQGVPPGDIVPVGKSPREFVKEAGIDGKVDIVLDFAGTKQTFSDAQVLVRRGGTIVGIGTLSSENNVDMHLCVRKRVAILFTYGGQRDDLVKVLEMISNRMIKPQVRVGKMADFPTILNKLHEGQLTGRIALIPDNIEPSNDSEKLIL